MMNIGITIDKNKQYHVHMNVKQDYLELFTFIVSMRNAEEPQDMELIDIEFSVDFLRNNMFGLKHPTNSEKVLTFASYIKFDRKFIYDRHLCMNNSYFFPLENGIDLLPPYNKYIQGYSHKENGGALVHLNQKETLGQIEFTKDNVGDLSKYRYRFNVADVENFSCNLDFNPIIVERDEFESWSKVDGYTSIKAGVDETTVPQSGQVVVKCNLVDSDGNDIKKEGVKIYCKTYYGYISKRFAYTDSEGVAAFTFLPLGLEKDEVSVLKFGYKIYTNIAQTKVKVI